MASSSSSRQDTVEIDRMYRTKLIHFIGKETRIILQNDNGPCPLLAICNVLLLRHEIRLNRYETEVSEERLLKLVAGRLMEILKNIRVDGGIRFQDVSDAFNLLPRLSDGMTVDVKFKRIYEFEFVEARILFQLLNIPLCHGWIVDYKHADINEAIGTKSYSTLQKELLPLGLFKPKEPVNPTPATDSTVVGTSADKGKGKAHVDQSEKQGSSSSAPNVVQEVLGREPLFLVHGRLIKKFLDDNVSQLTEYGLHRLHADLRDCKLCVFFRNNHFSTMFKFLGRLYILVTDEGYINEANVVWEMLDQYEVNGATEFVNHKFSKPKPIIHEIEEADEDEDKKNLAIIFEYIARPNKTEDSELEFAKLLEQMQLGETEKPLPKSDPPPRFASELVVGPEKAEYTPRPKPPRSALYSNKKSKSLKDKCVLM